MALPMALPSRPPTKASPPSAGGRALRPRPATSAAANIAQSKSFAHCSWFHTFPSEEATLLLLRVPLAESIANSPAGDEVGSCDGIDPVRADLLTTGRDRCGRNGGSRRARSPIPRRSRRWRRGSRRSSPARAGELVWLLEHPPLYTAGTSARPEDLLSPDRFPVYRGPARRRIHLPRAGPARGLCHARPQPPRPRRARLRLAARGVGDPGAGRLQRHAASVAPGRVGVWVVRPDRPPQPDGSPAEDKIAAIGVRIRRWVSLPRRRDQRRARPRAFRRHRALRHPRPRGDQPRRPRPAGDAGRSRPGAAAVVRRGLRPGLIAQSRTR